MAGTDGGVGAGHKCRKGKGTQRTLVMVKNK